MHPETTRLAKLIDHAVLHPTHGEGDTAAACQLGRRFSVAAVCVKPCFTKLAAAELSGSGVAACAVTGFPHGNSTVETKVFEADQAIQLGAAEIDVVVNNGLVAGSNWAAVAHEIAAIQRTCAGGGAILKAILETDFLEPAAIRELCRLCTDAGVAFVKTSTGFGYVKQPGGDFNYKGATVEAVETMRSACGPAVQIKASGGIRTLDELIRFRDLGCTRIGTAATEAILVEAEARFTGHPKPTVSETGGY